MSYNKETDYQAKINEAVKSGDYKSAAEYEKSRNEKIENENLPYSKTNNYSGWLDETDYSTLIRDKISSGASKESVSKSLRDRVEKASGTVGLSHYAYDDVYDEAIRYIMGEGNYSFKYDSEAPSYKNKYDSKIDSLYRQLEKLGEFSYDPFSDELYEYYKAQYNREGKRAMQDLLGVLSMNTGGVPSSYAVSAAGQVLDDYNDRLTDKIPELYEDAYDRYLETIKSKRDDINTLANLSENDYERYLDELSQYNKDREFEYRAYTDSLDNEKQLREFELEKESAQSENDYLTKKLLMEENENLLEWEQQKYENEKDKIEIALKKWKQLGYLDSESARILGLPVGLRTSDHNYKMNR